MSDDRRQVSVTGHLLSQSGERRSRQQAIVIAIALIGDYDQCVRFINVGNAAYDQERRNHYRSGHQQNQQLLSPEDLEIFDQTSWSQAFHNYLNYLFKSFNLTPVATENRSRPNKSRSSGSISVETNELCLLLPPGASLAIACVPRSEIVAGCSARPASVVNLRSADTGWLKHSERKMSKSNLPQISAKNCNIWGKYLNWLIGLFGPE